MDMTRDFLDGILDLDVPHEIGYADRLFTDKKMAALPRAITASALQTETLSSIVDYITSNADSFVLKEAGRFVIHIAGFNCVKLYKELNVDKERDNLITAEIENCRFPFGSFMSIEQFIINLQSAFVQSENTKSLLEFVSSIKDDSSVTQEDDGITQKVTAMAGISLAKTTKTPNPVYLQPYRTFTEIVQPESAFVFRIKKDDMRGVTAALFEADGGTWKHDAILEIKDFLKTQLHDDVIILA